MYTACAFLRDWESGVFEMNQTMFAESLMVQDEISATANIPGVPGVDLAPRRRLTWLSVMTMSDIATSPAPGTDRLSYRSSCK